MQTKIKAMPSYRSRHSDYCEFGGMALLLALALVQISAAFNASSQLMRNDGPIGRVMQSHDAPMFVKK
jgi:hypothetical protein